MLMDPRCCTGTYEQTLLPSSLDEDEKISHSTLKSTMSKIYPDADDA